MLVVYTVFYKRYVWISFYDFSSGKKVFMTFSVFSLVCSVRKRDTLAHHLGAFYFLSKFGEIVGSLCRLQHFFPNSPILRTFKLAKSQIIL